MSSLILYSVLNLQPRRKRQYPSAGRSQGYSGLPQNFSQPTGLEHGYPAPMPQYAGYEYQSPSAKRPRTSFSTVGRDPYESDPRHGPFTNYPTSYNHSMSQGQAYVPAPLPAPAPYSDYSYGHQRTNSSATSSPYVSPHDSSSYSLGPSQSFQQYQPRETYSPFHQPPHVDPQQRHIPQLAYPVPPSRQDPVTGPTKLEAPTATSHSAAQALTSLAQGHVHQPTTRPPGVEVTDVPAETPLRAPDRPILPPLHSTLSSSQTQGTAPQLQSSNVLPRIESHGSGSIGRQVDPHVQHEVSEA